MMTDLSNQNVRGPLAEAAERLDRIARVVKDQQLSETRSGPRSALSETFIASPEEAWAKKFMTQAIGPATTPLSAVISPGFIPVGQAPLASHGFVATSAAAAPRAPAAAFFGDLRPGAAPMRTAETGRRRSFLGWLFLGR
jgi:hypothetical protein